MARSWIDSIKSTGVLTVFARSAVQGGAWANAWTQSFTIFNSFGSRVSLTQTTDEANANVIVDAVDGPVTVEFTTEFSVQRYSQTIDGNEMHGRTITLPQGYSYPNIEKAYIFLPSQPQITASSGRRLVGIEILKVILVHEFVHACGLENSDHSVGDLFQGAFTPTPGTSPPLDRIQISPSLSMPPIILSSSTVSLINSVWS